MPQDYPADLRKLVTPKTAIISQGNGLKPKLCITTCMSNMNVRRLSSLETEEEESVSANP